MCVCAGFDGDSDSCDGWFIFLFHSPPARRKDTNRGNPVSLNTFFNFYFFISPLTEETGGRGGHTKNGHSGLLMAFWSVLK